MGSAREHRAGSHGVSAFTELGIAKNSAPSARIWSAISSLPWLIIFVGIALNERLALLLNNPVSLSRMSHVRALPNCRLPGASEKRRRCKKGTAHAVIDTARRTLGAILKGRK